MFPGLSVIMNIQQSSFSLRLNFSVRWLCNQKELFMNFKNCKPLILAVCLAVTPVAMTGCTASGEHISAYKHLRTQLSYSQTFRIPSDGHEVVYLGVRDLSGVNMENDVNHYLREAFMSRPGFTMTTDPKQATLRVYVSFLPVQATSHNAQGGVATGAIAGAAVGTTIAATTRHLYWRPEGSLLVLGLGLLGAGIGYAAESEIRIDRIIMSMDLEVEHSDGPYSAKSGNYDTYRTTVTCSGSQMNMDYRSAKPEMLRSMADGTVNMIFFR